MTNPTEPTRTCETRYLINRDFNGIHRVDRETECYYVTDRGTFDSRSKKQPGDMLFPTFADAQEALVAELKTRLARAKRLVRSDVSGTYEGWPIVFVQHPFKDSREGECHR